MVSGMSPVPGTRAGHPVIRSGRSEERLPPTRQTTDAGALVDHLPHTHVALDDAIAQGALFCNMLKENRSNES